MASEDPKSPRVRKATLAELLADARLRKEWGVEVEEDLVASAIEWLQEKWGDNPCPYCGVLGWEVSSPVAIQLASGETVTPSFPVMCSNCGQTVFVNAVRAGLLPEPSDE